MSQLNDEIVRVTGGPTVNDGLASWFGKTAGESLQDAEFRWLGEQLASGNTISDRWVDFMGVFGINDARYDYWSNFSGELPAPLAVQGWTGEYNCGVELASGGTPALAWSRYEPLDDAITLTITTDGTNDFTAKTNPKPLFWWSANEGEYPNLTIGRENWDDGFTGTLNTSILAANSSQSYYNTVNNGNVIGGRVNFVSDNLYMFRKIREGYDITTDMGLRTRYTGLTGTLNVGDMVTGSSSGATGVIVSFYDDGGGAGGIYYNSTDGTINDEPRVIFDAFEAMTSDAGASMTNNETEGLLISFNNKIFRIYGGSNNVHVNAQGYDGAEYRINPELTDNTYYHSSWENVISSIPDTWVAEEIAYTSSALDVSDGHVLYYQDGVVGYTGTLITINTGNPTKYNHIFQHQVSNGAQPGSNIYYDCIYMDDTLHRVMVSDSSIWSDSVASEIEVQLPIAWTATSIEIQMRQGEFTSLLGKYLYVINSYGSPVTTIGVQLT